MMLLNGEDVCSPEGEAVLRRADLISLVDRNDESYEEQLWGHESPARGSRPGAEAYELKCIFISVDRAKAIEIARAKAAVERAKAR